MTIDRIYTLTRQTSPAQILDMDLLRDYIGIDPDTDACQHDVLRALVETAIDQGEQITGLTWREAEYRIDGLRRPGTGGIFLPISPVGLVLAVRGEDGDPIDASLWRATLSSVERGLPWARIVFADQVPCGTEYSVDCRAGWNRTDLPGGILGWLLNRVSTLYDIRGNVALGTVSANIPRGHVDGLLDRWVVRDSPYCPGGR